MLIGPPFYSRLTKKYCARFPNIMGIHFVSSLNGKGMDALLGSLQSIIANQARLMLPPPPMCVRVRWCVCVFLND